MKKLFISCPMRGRTEENIRNSMDKMHKLAELVFGEELEVIDSYIEHDPPENVNRAVYMLGESIKKLSKADYFIGIMDIRNKYKGCDIEEIVAHHYDIKKYMINESECDFFKDIHGVTGDIYYTPAKPTRE